MKRTENFVLSQISDILEDSIDKAIVLTGCSLGISLLLISVTGSFTIILYRKIEKEK